MKKATIRSVLVVLVSIVICTSLPAQAVTRTGELTDDSVCNVGLVPTSDMDAKAAKAFVSAQCKNGQVLMGFGLPRFGLWSPDTGISNLAATFCKIANVQTSGMEVDDGARDGNGYNLRCTISKMPH